MTRHNYITPAFVMQFDRRAIGSPLKIPKMLLQSDEPLNPIIYGADAWQLYDQGSLGPTGFLHLRPDVHHWLDRESPGWRPGYRAGVWRNGDSGTGPWRPVFLTFSFREEVDRTAFVLKGWGEDFYCNNPRISKIAY